MDQDYKKNIKFYQSNQDQLLTLLSKRFEIYEYIMNDLCTNFSLLKLNSLSDLFSCIMHEFHVNLLIEIEFYLERFTFDSEIYNKYSVLI